MDPYILGYIQAKAENINKTLEHCMSIMNRETKKHRVINSVWPYAVGIIMGISAVTVITILFK